MANWRPAGRAEEAPAAGASSVAGYARGVGGVKASGPGHMQQTVLDVLVVAMILEGVVTARRGG